MLWTFNVNTISDLQNFEMWSSFNVENIHHMNVFNSSFLSDHKQWDNSVTRETCSLSVLKDNPQVVESRVKMLTIWRWDPAFGTNCKMIADHVEIANILIISEWCLKFNNSIKKQYPS